MKFTDRIGVSGMILAIRAIFLVSFIATITFSISCSSPENKDIATPEPKSISSEDKSPASTFNSEEIDDSVSNTRMEFPENESDGIGIGILLAVLLCISVLVGTVCFILYKIYEAWYKPIIPPDGDYKVEEDKLPEANLGEVDLSPISTENGNTVISDTPDAIRQLASRIKSLEESIETTNILRKQKEDLEADLKNYIHGYNFSVLKMAINDLIEAYEFAMEAEGMLEQSSFPESGQVKGYLTPISMYLKQGLEMSGIEQFTPEIGTSYQKTLGCDLSSKTPTADKELVGLISAIERPGWRSSLPTNSSQQEILRNAQVSVYVPLEE